MPSTPTLSRSLIHRALASDLVDRLTAPHGVDRYLELIDPSWVVRPDPKTSTPPSPNGTMRAATVVPEAPNRGADVDSATTETGVVVTFARSELTAPVDGTLLASAEAAGLTPKTRCRRGICGTCTTPKLAGTTRNTITGETSTAPGPIRICVTEACDDDLVLDL